MLTDLFFPIGDMESGLIQEVLPHYEAFAERKYPANGNRMVYRALQAAGGLFDMTPEQYVEEIMLKLNDNTKIVQVSREAIKNQAKYLEYLALIE